MPCHRNLVLTEWILHSPLCLISPCRRRGWWQFLCHHHHHHHQGMMAVPLSQACPESKALMPRDAAIWNWGIMQERYLHHQQWLSFWTPDSQALSLLRMRDGKMLSPFHVRKKNILVAPVTSAFVSWVCCQGPKCQPSGCSEQGLRGSRELGADPNL